MYSHSPLDSVTYYVGRVEGEASVPRVVRVVVVLSHKTLLIIPHRIGWCVRRATRNIKDTILHTIVKLYINYSFVFCLRSFPTFGLHCVHVQYVRSIACEAVAADIDDMMNDD